MHICIPDTREIRPPHGSAYLLYNVHIDGLYHCSLRFKQLLHLHQALTKKFTGPCHQLPPFPPKKLLPLSASQVEERRMQLEKYLQNISQDKAISNSSIFNLFLLEAQRESTRTRESQVHLDVELVNGQKIRLQIVTHDSADAVLTAVCRALGLNDRYHAYFCLCLCGYDVVRDKLIIKRRLSFFEAPFITLQMAIQQQEQLQNVLSSTTTTTTNISNNNNSSINNNNNDCRCLSCSTQQQLQSNTTGVPLVGSSSGSSYVNSNQQQLNHYTNQQHQHHSCNSNHASYYNWQSLASSSSRSFVTHRILLRKSYWDPIYDSYILNDQQALNLLFIQTVYDIKHSLMFVDRETYHQLESLLASDSKLEYILLARTLKYYNYVHFEPCFSDYPRPRTKVMISIGSKELNMRVLKSPKSISSSSTSTRDRQQSPSSSSGSSISPNEPILYCTSSLVPSGYHHLITKDDIVEEEYNFKVPLIRCWRLTSLETLNSCHGSNNYHRQSTTTLAGGKRKSLSLFNSVVGNSSSNNNTNESHRQQNLNPSPGDISSTLISSGIDGASLMAALTGSYSNSNTFFRCSSNNNSSTSNHQYCQHENQRCEPMQQVVNHTQFSQYELSFEYLVSKDTLKWITISSDQAIFISISLQGVVDELVSKRDGRCSLYDKTIGPDHQSNHHSSQLRPSLSGRTDNNNSNNSINQQQRRPPDNLTYMYRDGTQKLLNTSNQQLIDKFGTTLGYSPMSPYALAMARQRQQVRASALLSTTSSIAPASQAASPSTLWSPEVTTGSFGSGQPAAFEISVSI